MKQKVSFGSSGFFLTGGLLGLVFIVAILIIAAHEFHWGDIFSLPISPQNYVSNCLAEVDSNISQAQKNGYQASFAGPNPAVDSNVSFNVVEYKEFKDTKSAVDYIQESISRLKKENTFINKIPKFENTFVNVSVGSESDLYRQPGEAELVPHDDLIVVLEEKNSIAYGDILSHDIRPLYCVDGKLTHASKAKIGTEYGSISL